MQEVQLQVTNNHLVVRGSLGEWQYPKESIKVHAPMKNCPIAIEPDDGSRLEIAYSDYDHSIFQELLPRKSRALHWLENHYVGVLTSLVVVVLSVVFFVKEVVPQYSKEMALVVPQSWANKFDQLLIENLDAKSFSPSNLSDERTGKLTNFLHQHSDPTIRILFRKFGKPNAFALAGNTVIFSDEFINLMDMDEEILAVYFHELAHLEQRHLLSSVISASSVAVLSFFIVGDMAGATESLYNLGAVLINAKYSRSFEAEADQIAYQKLEKLGLSKACFSQALQKVTKNRKKVHSAAMEALSYLSSHPLTEERVAAGNGEPCKSL